MSCGLLCAGHNWSDAKGHKQLLFIRQDQLGTPKIMHPISCQLIRPAWHAPIQTLGGKAKIGH